MRTRRPSPEHQEAVERRLALLSAELAAVRPGPLPDEPEQVYVMPETHTRVAVPARDPEVVPEPDPAPAPVPEPGRHAARRFRRGLGEAVPATLRGRVALGPGQLAVVAVLVAVGLAVTAWWVVRGEPRTVAAPPLGVTVTGAGPALATPVGQPSATATVADEVTVDVAGRVRRPGIAVLPAGARVIDAIEAAGGARPGVDLSSVNLARLLVDGEQILVGAPVPAGVAVPAPAGPAPSGALVNLNTADAATLETLPDVGPVTAEAIIAWRTEHGGFTAVEELLEVDGIGEATLATIAPHATV